MNMRIVFLATFLSAGVCIYAKHVGAQKTATQKENKNKQALSTKKKDSKNAAKESKTVSVVHATQSIGNGPQADQKKEDAHSSSKDQKMVAEKSTRKNEKVAKKEMNAERVYLDGIACAVNGPERCEIFCESDKYRHGLAPMMAKNDTEKLELFAFNELVYQNWLQIMDRQKMDPNDNTIVNNYIDGLCRQNNWSMNDLEKILAQSGYTLQDGIKELKKMYAVNYMSEMKMQGVVVPENEIEAYYKAHPLYNEPSIKISHAFISYGQATTKEDLVKKLAKNGQGITIEWEEPFWLKESEMADHMKFLLSVDAGAIADPLETNGGFELFKIIVKKPRRLVSLKKRYNHIVAQLRHEKSSGLFKTYKNQLFDSASIVYFSHDAV